MHTNRTDFDSYYSCLQATRQPRTDRRIHYHSDSHQLEAYNCLGCLTFPRLTSELALTAQLGSCRKSRHFSSTKTTSPHDSVTNSPIRRVLILTHEFLPLLFNSYFLLIHQIRTTKSTQALVHRSMSQITSNYSIQSQLYFHGVIQSNLIKADFIAFHSTP